MPLEWEYKTKQQKRLKILIFSWNFSLVIYRAKLYAFSLFFYISSCDGMVGNVSFFLDVEAYFRIKHFIPLPHRLSAPFNPKCRRLFLVAAAYAILNLYNNIRYYLIVIRNYCETFSFFFMLFYLFVRWCVVVVAGKFTKRLMLCLPWLFIINKRRIKKTLLCFVSQLVRPSMKTL